MTDHVPFVLDLRQEQASHLEIVGGKGANLAILCQRGFSVPHAFIITTSAFQCVLDDDQTKQVLREIDQIDVDNIQQLENTSDTIKTTICSINLPTDMTDLIINNYNKLCEKNATTNLHVAVRSSATAEDLPDNSFAGQQDTYLHVTRDNLIEKVKECWASLFTARAISYRKKSNIDHKIVKLAVVVQEMIFSEVSGVAFTANPITGRRNEVVIDSTYGLGEALVSGLVTPDHYEILFDKNENVEIRIKQIGEKSIRIIGKSDGGTETIHTTDSDKRIEAISDECIIELAKLAKQVEKSYDNLPQDLEWGYSNGKLYILQARPITTLFPIPQTADGQSDLRCMISFGTVQGFLEPMTPLGQSVLRTLLGSLIKQTGVIPHVSIEDNISSNPSRHYLFKSSANRMWIDITGILTSPLSKIFGVSMVDTGIGKIINYLVRSKSFRPAPMLSSIRSICMLLTFFIPLILRSIRNFIFPRYGKNLFMNKIKEFHKFVNEGFRDPQNQSFTDYTNHFINIQSNLARTVVRYGGPCIVPCLPCFKFFENLAKDPMDALALTRAVESNPTTEMNLDLWKLTVLIRDDPTTSELFQRETTNTLTCIYKNKSLKENIQSEMDQFFRVYGCRGIGEIDIGRKRWSDQPENVIDQIKNYLKIQNPDKAIDKIHDQSKESAYRALENIERQLRLPFIQRPLVNLFFYRLKVLFSIRECPKFYGIIYSFDKCRKALLCKAELAVDSNLISNPDDIFFLYIDELKSLADDTDYQRYEKGNYWKSLIAQRRGEYDKQKSCKRVPLVLLSDGRTYYDATLIPDENNEQKELVEGEYIGSPVSPGLYEGKVRIVDDPLKSELQPGEVLVCTATDPAWTSLFPMAGALVLEMGGMLQHGAIVSREYGLPAVVGVSNAKLIFHNGQMIQVNGSTGRIKVLSD